MLEIKKIHEDDRGEIYSIVGDTLKENYEIVLLITKKGYARGGCVHPNSDEYCTVLEGSVKYWLGNELPEWLHKGMSIMIPKSTPHFFRSQRDSIIAEWGPNPEEKDIKDIKMRNTVMEINKGNKV